MNKKFCSHCGLKKKGTNKEYGRIFANCCGINVARLSKS